eukprot:799583_1
MGNTKSSQEQNTDLVHTLLYQPARRKSLINGCIRLSYKESRKLKLFKSNLMNLYSGEIPLEISTLCIAYIGELTIYSKTEIKTKYEGVFKQPHNELKIAVVGLSCVGKTSIVRRILTDEFVCEYEPAIDPIDSTIIKVENESFTVKLIDTTSADSQDLIRYRIAEADCILWVYSVSSCDSFDAIKGFDEMEKSAHNLDWNVWRMKKHGILCGNKSELPLNQRHVDTNKGIALKNLWGPNVVFMETSAKANINIDAAIIECVRLNKKRILKLKQLVNSL